MRTWNFPSSSNRAVSYQTTLYDDGRLGCSCRGWIIRRPNQPRHCTHTKKVAAEVGGVLQVRGEYVYLTVDPLIQREGGNDLLIAAPAAPAPKAPAVSMRAPDPMLASAMVDRVEGAAFTRRYGTGEWALEEKLDGHRCVVVVNGGIQAWSRPRQGKQALPRELPPHILAQLRRFPAGVYDGELVAGSGKAWDVKRLGSDLVLVLFDVLSAHGIDRTTSPYAVRRQALLTILGACLEPDQQAISTVESLEPTWSRVQAIWDRGGEGAILKRLTSRYRPGARTDDWTKVKRQHHAVLTITGFEAGKLGPFSILQARSDDGHDTTVRCRDMAMLKAVAADPNAHLGRRIVITFQERTPSGSFRHGVFDHWASDAEVAAARKSA